jgi:hypothetical protein
VIDSPKKKRKDRPTFSDNQTRNSNSIMSNSNSQREQMVSAKRRKHNKHDDLQLAPLDEAVFGNHENCFLTSMFYLYLY